MALIIPPGFYQVLVPMKHDRVTRPAAVTFGVREVEDEFPPDEMADQILLSFSASFAALLDSEVEVGPAIVTFDQGEQGRGSISGSNRFRGARNVSSVPSNTAVLFRKNTGRIGRPGRGRMFMPWYIQNTEVDEVGTLTNAALDARTTAGAGFLTSLNSRGLEMVILHDEDVPGTTTPSLVTSLVPDPVVGTQRRRLRQ